MTITIRPEEPADSAAIFDLTRLAFATAAHSAGTEQFIVGALPDAVPIAPPRGERYHSRLPGKRASPFHLS